MVTLVYVNKRVCVCLCIISFVHKYTTSILYVCMVPLTDVNLGLAAFCIIAVSVSQALTFD